MFCSYSFSPCTSFHATLVVVVIIVVIIIVIIIIVK